MVDYFSDRENGPRARTEQVISSTVWAGLVGTVQALINNAAFGLRFPECCPDGQAICGCDPDSLAAAVIAEMPGLAGPLETTSEVEDGLFSQRQPFAPDTLLILDFIEFVYASVAKPNPGKYHDFFSHHHLSFDQQVGQPQRGHQDLGDLLADHASNAEHSGRALRETIWREGSRRRFGRIHAAAVLRHLQPGGT